jgi:glucose-6-phosphate 1-dehydrogenase
MVKRSVTFVLFGGTGDLTKRKLVPAFANMVHNGVIGRNSTILGVSRKEFSDIEYKKFLLEGDGDKKEKRHIRNLNIKYFNGNLSTREGLIGLREKLDQCEVGNCDRVFYLATGFKFFGNVVSELKKQGLSKQSGGFTRVVFEKPFGRDLSSSTRLDKEIKNVFDEDEVYRIDHYLAKGTVQNLNVLKFTNPLIYSGFGNRDVESVEIVVDEDLGVGNRIGYYDGAGALKDMIQNHLLQVLSLVLMERPKKFEPGKIHNKKVEVLKNLEVLDSGKHLLGQYRSYASELKKVGIKKSKTETYAQISLNCKMKRWNGVRLILRTGKKLKRKNGYIRIKYKDAAEKFTSGFSGFRNNEIVFNIYPMQDVTIWMNTRTREFDNKVRPVKFEFCEECVFGPNTMDEYAILLGEVIRGDKTLFTRDDEVREGWRIVDKIEKMKERIRFKIYKDGLEPGK